MSETLESALGRAYINDPTLNAQRASLRASDEGVPQALAGYRPRVFGDLNAGITGTRSETSREAGVAGVSNTSTAATRGYGVTVEQPLFDGFRTPNGVRAAEAAVLAARETLRNQEQNTLFNAVEAYMNVLRDFATFDLQRNNVSFLEEELRATQERLQAGEVTRTDVAQSESRLAAARFNMAQAEANLKASRAIYRQRIGVDPAKLYPGKAIDRLLPATLDACLAVGHNEHPAIKAAFYSVDAAELQVKVAEGALLPTMSVEGAFSDSWDPSASVDRASSASVVGRVSVPIYQGGSEHSLVRQAKETLGQRRLEADISRDAVRAAVVSAWGALEAAKAQIISAQAGVEAADIALNGVREGYKAGQQTTLDVLDAQQELLTARVSLVTAQRDRVVASYALLQAIGRLSVASLALKVESYDPNVHYEQVRDLWHGLRTPDGR